MTEGRFDFKKFFDESKATLLTPSEYFAIMPKAGGYGDPLVKAVIYSLVAGLISFILGVFKLSTAAGPMIGIIGGGAGIVGVITSVMMGVIGLFIGGTIILVISSLCGGNTEYEANVRVAASLLVLSPVNALFGVLSGMFSWIGEFVFLAVSLYGLYLLYIAVTKSLGGKEATAKVVSIVLAVIPLLLILSAILCVKAVSTLPENMLKKMPVQNQEQLNKLTEDFNKALQDESNRLKDEGLIEEEK